ncbi:Phytanoyl-CoA dioxygenase [Teratosphaeria destructans]|uniref:Phytanoyl-CoA dioxygenase n=1 Tax=Teratosphaeria destructans TaxID=418781 RepID=A0A9W7SZ11_9PEZI|nr:Phytanoyl-CoA dioxygenase [Teratosphaeria destructans]
MSTTTTTTVSSKAEHKHKPIARDLVASGRVAEQQWHKDLVRDGYAVVKGAVPRERAEGYVDEMYSWLEAFDLGFKRDDPSTIRKEHLPVINEKGMCMSYSVAHEDFVWRVRSEPGVIDAFATVYDDQDLIVSFDAVNFGFGNRKDLPPNKPWPHQDQDPTKPGFRCLQGLVNLLPNGPDDGGLIVCKGGYQLSEEFHEVFKDEEKIPAWTPEWYGFTENGMKWLADKGCEWVKVCAEPGDLLIWDSRTPHYNLSPTSDRPRFCIYTCYMPVADASQEDLLRKKAAFEDRMLTSHWPNATYVGRIPAKRDGAVCPYERERPTKEPQLDERAYKLTGIPYLKRLGHENDSAVIQLTAGA